MPNGGLDSEHYPSEPLDVQVRGILERIRELENLLREAQGRLGEVTTERDTLRAAIALVRYGSPDEITRREESAR